MIPLLRAAILFVNQFRTNRAGDEVRAPQALGALLEAFCARDDPSIAILAGARKRALRIALIVFTLRLIAALRWQRLRR